MLVTGFSITAWLGVGTFVVIDSVISQGDAFAWRWLVLVPLGIYAIVAFPSFSYAYSSTWRGALHASALWYSATMIGVAWLVVRLMCIEQSDDDGTQALLRQSGARLFAQQLTTVGGVFIFTGVIRCAYEVVDARMQADDLELALLAAEAELEAHAHAEAPAARRRRKAEESAIEMQPIRKTKERHA